MTSLSTSAVERGNVEPIIDPRARAILERIARCAHMIDQHRRGIEINQARILEAQAELEALEGRA